MNSEMWIAVLSLMGTVIGSGGSVLIANKIVNYRLEQLEKKVEKHNNLVERVAVIERDEKTVFRLIDGCRDNIDELRKAII